MTWAPRWTRRFAPGAAILLAGAVWIWGPDVLRNVDAFAVRTVEVIGTRFVDPYDVVRAAGLDRDASVFDDPGRWRTGTLTLPLIESVEIQRRLPSTVALIVREVEPVALVSTPVLRPVGADGRLLPIEPAGALIDLPMLQGAVIGAGRLGGDGLAALRALTSLQREAPELARALSQVAVDADALRLVFRDGGAEALLPVRPTGVQLTQLRLAHADLSSRGELEQVRRIDLRFRDQVVVSFHPSPVS